MNQMTQPALAKAVMIDHVTDWVFDLDNTLYPRECNLFAQIDTAITTYVMELTKLDFHAARQLQKDYYRDHGTTLNGLMTSLEIDPDHYLDAVHKIDYSPVLAHPELVAAIAALPGRKFIFTNGSDSHARSVLHKLGAGELFEGIFDIKAAKYQPKPLDVAYESFLAAHGIDPTRSIMFDDLEKNLRVPHKIGMTTVQVVAGAGYVHEQCDAWELGRGEDHEHVHHVTDDIAGFLIRCR